MIRASALFLCLVAAGPAAAQTADDIVQRNVDARGGYAGLRAIRTIRVTGRQPIAGQDLNMTEATSDVQPAINLVIDSMGPMSVTLEAKRPNLMRRTYVTPNGGIRVAAFDGKEGWRWEAGQRNSVVMPGSGPTDFGLDGPLIDCERKGYRVELIGRAKAEGKDCYKLRITSERGGTLELYVDAATFLDVRLDVKSSSSGARTSYLGWRPVDGVMVPGTVVTRVSGITAQWMIDKVEFNVPLDDGRFARPDAVR
jgi:hypothetical protein